MVSNPQSATSPVIQSSLDNMPTPLPLALRYRIDALDSVLSSKTAMDAQISSLINDKEYYANEIINYYLDDTLPASQTSFIFFQAEDGIRDDLVDWSSDVCSSDLFFSSRRRHTR